MNQQAFYRDAAIGEWLEDGSYRSWGQRRRTLQVQQHRLNQSRSRLLQNVDWTRYGAELQNHGNPYVVARDALGLLGV